MPASGEPPDLARRSPRPSSPHALACLLWLALGLAAAGCGEATGFSVEVVACSGTTMTNDPPPDAPASLRTSLPAREIEGLRFYAFSGTVVLAPIGWGHCNGASGSSGASVTTSDTRLDLSPPGRRTPEQSVFAYVSSAGSNHPLYLACPWFAEARQKLDSLRLSAACDTSSVAPTGERQTRIDANELRFYDPPGITGTGKLSGGRNPAIGLALWIPARSSRGGLDEAATVTCTLTRSANDRCLAIINDFRLRFREQISR